uniref:Uncharacterized protein n=1 Tax=viral metagenome TaxID=1070528 RepID=A0A6C0CRK7_9ZZZZ
MVWFQNLTQHRIQSNTISYQSRLKRFLKNPLERFDDDDASYIIIMTVNNDLDTVIVYESNVGFMKTLRRLYSRMVSNIQQRTILKFDIVVSYRSLHIRDKPQLNMDNEGIALNASLLLLPDQIVSHSLNTLDEIFVFLNLNKINVSKIYLFKTRSYVYAENNIEILYRGQKLFKTLRPNDVESAAHRASQYLNNAVLSTGRFDYMYKVDSDESGTQYNVLRHAGTVFAMAKYSRYYPEHTSDVLYKAVQYLVSLLRPGLEDPQTLCIVDENNEVKLGGVGLTLLALCEYSTVYQTNTYDDIIKKLADWVPTQIDDSGDFYGYVQYYETGRYKAFKSEYFPGEIIYGVMEAYKLFKQVSWLNVCVSIARYIIEVRDQFEPDEKLPHDHWMLYGLNELHRYAPHVTYLGHVRRLLRVISRAQTMKDDHEDHDGSFYDEDDPRSTPAATRAEGMIAGFCLIHDFDPKSIRLLKSVFMSIQRSLSFQLRTQYNEINTMYVKNPRKSFGGFRESIHRHRIRIDYVQHNLVSILNYMRIKKHMVSHISLTI